jgi:hypothetical protein
MNIKACCFCTQFDERASDRDGLKHTGPMRPATIATSVFFNS